MLGKRRNDAVGDDITDVRIAYSSRLALSNKLAVLAHLETKENSSTPPARRIHVYASVRVRAFRQNVGARPGEEDHRRRRFEVIVVEECEPRTVCAAQNSIQMVFIVKYSRMSAPELPTWQDCHELWSKKRRKQLREQQESLQNLPPGKPAVGRDGKPFTGKNLDDGTEVGG